MPKYFTRQTKNKHLTFLNQNLVQFMQFANYDIYFTNQYEHCISL